MSHVRWQIEFKHRQASPKLLERLVNAVIFRRRKLEYRKRHHEKLSHGVEEAFTIEVQEPVSSKGAADESRVSPSPAAARRGISPKTPGSVKSTSQTVTFSATEASSINHLKVSPYPKSIAVSAMTKSAVARRGQLDVPRPPDFDGPDKETVCPYCFRVVDKKELKDVYWTFVNLFFSDTFL
ncbi:hypothetical protein VTN77DRAFT_6518 [Rasamsonia byssochlamydoides]|uniref:uncharacterized protein n=1 Tax=Rasamsonia byssochlamydoides TaxID=89139 RepID=UPI003743ED80